MNIQLSHYAYMLYIGNELTGSITFLIASEYLIPSIIKRNIQRNVDYTEYAPANAFARLIQRKALKSIKCAFSIRVRIVFAGRRHLQNNAYYSTRDEDGARIIYLCHLGDFSCAITNSNGT